MSQPTNEFAVQPSALVLHANHIDVVADEIGTAKGAGDAVRVDSGAYGQLCQIVPVVLNSLQDLLLDGIGAAQESLHDTGERLRTAARSYQGTDQQREQDIQRLRGLM